MKIFGIVDNYPQHNKAAAGALYEKDGSPVLFTKADSALLKDRKPFFVPDWCGTITRSVNIVVPSGQVHSRAFRPQILRRRDRGR